MPPMRARTTRRLPFLLSCACSLALTGCGAATPAGSPTPDARSLVDSMARPADDSRPRLPDLRLDALHAERPPLPENARNPFRFGPRAATAASPAHPELMPPHTAAGPRGAAFPRPADSSVRDAPAGAASSGLRLVGIVEAPRTAGPVAVLTDARGVHHGQLGDAVDGRYRIVAFQDAAVEIEDLARGERMTLRMGG